MTLYDVVTEYPKEVGMSSRTFHFSKDKTYGKKRIVFQFDEKDKRTKVKLTVWDNSGMLFVSDLDKDNLEEFVLQLQNICSTMY